MNFRKNFVIEVVVIEVDMILGGKCVFVVGGVVVGFVVVVVMLYVLFSGGDDMVDIVFGVLFVICSFVS